MPLRPASDRPNVVVIFCDDLGYGDLSCYGSPLNRTPRLDRMAAEGARLTDFYVAAPVCSPSRAALMTGCYPQRVGLQTGEQIGVLLPGESIGLSPEEVTLADVLKARGYATRHIGKWHLGDQEPFLPTRHGFDAYFGLPYSNDMGRALPKWDFPPLPLMRDDGVVEIEPDQARLTHRYTAEAVEFIRAHRDEPFFLYFAHMYVHCPLSAPEEYVARSRNGVYGAEVEVIDWSTGVILDTLSELGIDENTLVLFTSDNGANRRNGSSNAPLRGAKGSTWEGGMREPCIVRWPGSLPAGAVRHQVLTAMDLLPTVARLAGGEPPGDRVIDGRDMLPALCDPEVPSPHEAFFYYSSCQLQAVRSGRWKLRVAGEPMLTDLYDDVGETTDVAGDHREVVERLEALAERCRDDLGDGTTARWVEGHRHPGEWTRAGRNVRPAGRVAEPRPLTSRAADDPLTRSEYD